MSTLTPSSSDISRRDLFRYGAIGAAGIALAPFINSVTPEKAFATQYHTGLGGYRLVKCYANRNYSLDIAGKSSANGGNVQIAKVNNLSGQIFRFDVLNTRGNKYRIVPLCALLQNKCIGKAGGASQSSYYNKQNVEIRGYSGAGATNQQWYIDKNNNGSSTIIIQEGKWPNDIDWCMDKGKGFSNNQNVFIYKQDWETGDMGSWNPNQQWLILPATFKFDINPDDNKYGTNYSNGGRLKSYDVKATDLINRVTETKGVSDYNKSHIINSTYEVSNIVYKDGYMYDSYSLSGGKIIEAAEDGSYFKIQHTPEADIALSINTKEIPFEPPVPPTKSYTITD